jgi:hypothetical protein
MSTPSHSAKPRLIESQVGKDAGRARPSIHRGSPVSPRRKVSGDVTAESKALSAKARAAINELFGSEPDASHFGQMVELFDHWITTSPAPDYPWPAALHGAVGRLLAKQLNEWIDEYGMDGLIQKIKAHQKTVASTEVYD